MPDPASELFTLAKPRTAQQFSSVDPAGGRSGAQCIQIRLSLQTGSQYIDLVRYTTAAQLSSIGSLTAPGTRWAGTTLTVVLYHAVVSDDK